MLDTQNKVYIFHKNGANSHYLGLNHLLDKKGMILEYREFSIISKVIKAILTLNANLFKKQLINFCFIINLVLTKNKKIVLGIAPFDSKLKLLLRILQNHKVFYHTSWTYWDKSFHPKQKNNSAKVYQTWCEFLEKKCNHLFAVTQQSKNQLLKNYNISNKKISVVYHSLDGVFKNEFKTNKKSLSFIYFGRLVPQKGLKELVNYFEKQENAILTIVGDGKEKHLITSIADTNNSIRWIPHISNKQKLAQLLNTQQYLVLNSIRTQKWEELFGMAIIEAMSQGVIPIATNHSGPKEIITEDVGLLTEEGEITLAISKLINKTNFDVSMSNNAKLEAKKYYEESIAQRWQPILY